MNPDEENYAPGDIIHITPTWQAKYPGWKVSRGVVMTVKKSFVFDKALGASDKAMYQQRYGAHEKYPFFEMLITAPEGNYLVCQFGFNKDNNKEE